MRTYSFANTIVLVNGVEITGFAEGDDVIDIKRLNDSASHKIGADGNMMTSLSADKSGSIAIKLNQTSSSNKFLSKLHTAQEAMGSRCRPVQVMFQDTYRNDLASGSLGYIKTHADTVRGAQGQKTEWTFIVEKLDQVLGDPETLGSFLG